MKLTIIYSLVLVAFFSYNSFANEITFAGKVIDANTKEPLPGAIVGFPDLKISISTNNQGEFSLRNIPAKGNYLAEVRYIGYKTLTRVVDLGNASSLVFALEPTAIETKEVVITGTAVSGSSKKSSTSSSAVNRSQLLVPSTNLIDALAKVPGVSQISTGLAISKPVIRGLGYNRVVTLDDGIKQQGQQWGDEHGIEIDQFKADHVEVLRGAASLLYGSDALGGVINLIEPLSPPEGKVKGEIVSNYSTNNGLSANSLMFTGNENGFVWRGRASYKNAYSYKTPTEYFPNSGYNETDLSGMVGLSKSWGYSHLNFSSFRNNIGFYEPQRNGSGNFVNDEGDNFASTDLKNRTISYPRQDIRHYKLALNNNISAGSGNLKIDLGYQKNQRREFDSANPNLFFDLNTYNTDVKYYPRGGNGWQPVFGLSGDVAASENKGEKFLVPAYNTYGLGAFAYVKKNMDLSSFNAGIRYDYRNNQGKELIINGNQKFAPFTNSFSNISGALGFTHQLGELWDFKANAGSAFRAPNPAELGSNGVHEGTFRYEKGNASLTPERSYQTDISLEYESKAVSFNTSVYNNYINNYIYAANANNTTVFVDYSYYPVYTYGQVNANLYGAEASLTIHPVPAIHFENTFGYTHAQNLTLNKPLPFIPAGSLRNELKYEPKLKKMTDTYFSIGIASFFQQNRVDPEFEPTSAGYTLLNASIGAGFKLGKQSVRLSVSGSNLLDKKYYDALSRLKPGRLDQTDPTLGVYNPGRNITFGLYVPLSF